MSLTDEWLNKGNQLGADSMVLKFISKTLAASIIILLSLPQVLWPQQQCESQPIDAGYRGFSYDSGSVNSEPTEEKPESKLWHTDGFWWGLLWDPADQVFSVHRFNQDSQCWTAVGPGSDDRGRTSQDAFWDEEAQKLYIASHGKLTLQESQPQDSRLYRYSYNSGSDTYTLDSGFPVTINNEKSRSLVIAKDSAGKLWASWTSGLRVMVNSASNDGANWGVPFELPGQGNDLKQDDTGNTLDISAIIAFGEDKIGVFWGNQIDKKYYFMVHEDGDPDAIWQPREIALQGFFGNAADDHINLTWPSNHDMVVAVVKSDINGSSNPLIRVLKRDPDLGVWTAHIFGLRSEEHTRPIVVIDSDTDSVYVFAKSAVVEPSAIYFKVAHIDDMNFPPGLGRVFMRTDVEDNINNPTSTKQNVNAGTGLLVAASNKQLKRYMHNYLALGGNHGPNLVDDTASTPQNTPLPMDVTANDTDQDDSIDVTTVQLVDSASNGSLSVDPGTGIVTYTPTAGFLGTDSFRYSARDQDGESNVAATVNITVHVNNLPVANADEALTDEEVAVAVDVLANDSDSDGTVVPATVQISSPPTNGAVQVNDTTGVVTYTPNLNFVGNDAFSYTVQDNSGGTSNSGTVTVTVSDVNDPPVAVDDNATTSEDAMKVIDVTANDSDIDGTVDVTTVFLTSAPESGQATVNPTTGEITYTPNTDFVGADDFTYTVNDEDGAASSPATVTVNVTSINDPPIAAPDTAITDEDGAIVIAVLSNDSDVDGTIVPSTLALVTQPDNGSVTVNTVNGLITYTPSPGFNGTDSFLYSVTDNEGAASQGTTTIIVNDINDAPVASDDGAATEEDVEVVIDILGNDTDSDGTLAPSTVTILSNVSDGATAINPTTGEVTYTPNPEFSGNDSFTYTVNDDDGESSNVATVTIEVGGLNDAPVAVNDQAVTNKDNAVNLNVAANDTDVDGTINPLTVAPTAALNGTIAVMAGGVVRYTPNPGFVGNDTFTYTVRDDQGALSNIATVSIKINEYPVASDDNGSTHEGSAVIIEVLTNDTDSDGTLDPASVALASFPSEGTASINTVTGDITYTPGSGFSGSDSFTYAVNDNDGATSNAATVSIAVNDLPVAVTDAAFTNANNPVSIAVASNDTDSDGSIDPTTVTINSGPTNGSVNVDPSTGRVTYNPNQDFFGSDALTYTIQDNEGASSAPGSVVIEVNAFPVAADDAITTDEDTAVDIPVTANDSDQDGDLVVTTVILTSAPSNGTASVNATTGMIQYTPNADFFGTDTFSYTVTDNDDAQSNEAQVTVTVNDVNDSPVAGDDVAATGEEATVTIDVTANDTDLDGTINVASVSVISSPPNGNLVLNTGTGEVSYTPKQNFEGTDSFAYTVSDDDGGVSNVATVTVTVSGENDAPVAQDDSGATEEDVAVTIDILSNDSDVDGSLEPTSVSIIAPASSGTTSINLTTGAIIYTPNENYFGTDSFTYTVRDDAGLTSNVAVVSLTIADVNDPPVAGDDVVATGEDTPTSIAVLDNDSDVDGVLQVSSLVILSGVSNGSTSIDGTTGSVTYTPDPNFEGTDTFTYTVSDDDGGVSNVATVTVTVSSENDQPLAQDDSSTTDEDVVVTIDVLANDSDVDGSLDPASVNIVTAASNGTTTVDETTGAITYTPNANFFGVDSVTYTVRDDIGLTSNVANVALSVVDVNDRPLAINDTSSTAEDTEVTIPVAANDSDIDGSLQNGTVAIVTGASNGSTSIDGNSGAITYAPNPDFFGSDSFTYTISDDDGGISDEASVVINVLDQNDLPLAVDDSVATDEDNSVAIALLNNDSDVDGALQPSSVTILVDPNNGATVIDSTTGTVTYTPEANFFGVDSFTYSVSDDDDGTSNPATVTVQVNDINDAPVALDDARSTGEDAPIVISVLSNDSDVDGSLDLATVTITVEPSNGSASVDGSTGEITYTPSLDFVGLDSLIYSVRDDDGDESNPGKVTLTVSGENDPPVAVDDQVATQEDSTIQIGVLANDTDVEGGLDSASLEIDASPSNGAVSVDGETGVITYRPSENFFGTDSFTYTVRDDGGLISNPAIVTVTVSDVNDPPVAFDDAGATSEETTVTLLVTENDTDVDGTVDVTTLNILNAPGNGTVVVDGTTGEISYTPNQDFVGVDSLRYTVRDDDGGESNPATLVITVSGENDPPVAADDQATTNEDVVVEVSVTSNDSDVDGTVDPTTVAIVSAPQNGTVSVNATTGMVSYSPSPNFFGSDTLTYTVRDDGGLISNAATVTVTIADVNDLPVAVNDSTSTTEETAVTIDLAINDTDEDGTVDLNTLAVVTPPSNGTAVLVGNGQVNYLPIQDFEGTDTFTYSINDDDGDASNPATVTVTVTGTPDPPVAANDLATTDEDRFLAVDVVSNDFDTDTGDAVDPSSIIVVSAPANGTIVVSTTPGFADYTPRADFSGTDSFTYTVKDNTGLTSTPAIVTITVNPVNDPPLAQNDVGFTGNATPVTINVLQNDSGTDGIIDPTTVTVTGAPFSGTTSVDPLTGAITYTPDAGFSGTDGFLYTVDDNNGLSSNPATVNINVSGRLFPIHDSFVRSSVTQPRGNGDILRVRAATGGVKQFAFLKFEVTGLPGAVETAKLFLFVSDGSDQGGDVHLVSNDFLGTSTPWDEAGLIFDNAPEIDGTQRIATIGPVTSGQTVEIDVTSVITGNGVYSFAIRNESDDAAEYSPREQASPPELIIETNSISPLVPVIAGFDPSSGPVGTEVTITGANLGTTTEVSFNGQSAPNFNTVSDSELTVSVPNGATAGRIRVTNQEGSVTSADDFDVFLSPTIFSISPSSGPVGAEVTILGANLGGVTDVSFGSTAASSFSIISTLEIRALVPTGTVNGPISVSNVVGTAASSASFTLVELPSITSLSPTSGPVNTEVTVSGSNFVELSSVDFNGTPAVSFDVDSGSQLRVRVPLGATTGRVNVRNAAGSVASDIDFELLAAPEITFFTPAGGLPGTEVTISGRHFANVNEVAFSGSAADFDVDSDTQLRATVPNGATSGLISVTNGLGTDVSENNFVVTGLPTIISFNPANGATGTEVTITGTAFSNVSSVSFNGSFASSFSLDSDSQIRATLPAGATTGKIRLSNVAGDGESLGNFIVTSGPSSLTFNPTDDSFVRSNRATSNYGDGDVLRSRASRSAEQFLYLKFNVTGVTSGIQTATLRLFVVTGSDDGGAVFVASNSFLGDGNPWNEEELNFANAPDIDNSALSAIGAVSAGQTVEFDVTSAVTGNGVFSFALRNNSDTAVEYSPKEVGNAPELVLGLSGGGSSNGPVISGFSPAGGVPGTEVTVTGNNLLGTTDVFFNSISAASFSMDHDGQIRAVVGAGSSSGKVGVTSPEGTALSATDFVIVSAPTVSLFSPTSGPAGTEVTLVGSNFTGTTEVRFGGILAFGFVVDSDTRLRVNVPAGAGVGPVSVANGAGTAVSSGDFIVIVPPVVSSFTPSSGAEGTTVTVTGNNLSSIAGVFFNGVASTSFQVDSDNQVTTNVPAGASTGAVSVTNAAGTAVSSQTFEVLGPPVITSFTPAGGLSGTEVTILGTNFTNASGAAFNGLPAANFQIDSATRVRATVPSGATSGPISVTNSVGTGVSSTNYIVAPSPIITAFDPLSGSAGTEVTLTGSNLSNASTVQFGGVSALNFNVDSDFQIRATVPPGASSGKIRVNNISGSGESLANFVIASGPSTLTFDASDDAYVRSNRRDRNFGAGTVLRLRETSNNVQESYIKFDLAGLTGTVERARLRLFVADGGSQGGSIIVVSNNWDEDTITFDNAPAISGSAVFTLGAVSTGQTVEFDVTSAISGNGTISFGLQNDSDDAVEYASSDVANGPQLIVDLAGGASPNAPVVTSFSPTGGVVGTQVTITGNNFLGTTDVFFSNISASSFEVDSNNQIRAVVGPGSATGKVGVSSLEGTGLSSADFVLVGPPVITSFGPRVGPVGTEVTFFGSNFSGTLGVRFNGVFAPSFSVASDAQLRATVPSGATTGTIGVENSAGTATTSGDFTVTLLPAVASFTPTSGPVGTVVTVTGSNFSSLTGVSFNGVTASTFNVDSSTQLRATVPALGSTGPIRVTNAAGTAASPGSFEVLGPPVVTSFEPAGGLAGTQVTITGSNFDNVTGIAFNGSPATIFTVLSGSEIRATVPGGANTGSISVSNNIGTAFSNADFVVAALPTITAIDPLTGPAGTVVTISGSNFLNSLGVDFGITPASEFQVDSNNQIRATVPAGAASGTISVRNIAGTQVSGNIFIVTAGPTTLSFEPIDDSFVRENQPTDVSGDGDVLRVRKSNSNIHQISYLKFAVTGLTREVERATLRLRVSDGGGQAGSIFLVSNDWQEETVNWNNAPAISGSPLMSLGGVSAGQVIEFVVTSAIAGDGVYSFAIRTGSDDAVEFSSKEVSNPPQLVVEQSGGPAPNAPAITAFSPAGGVVGSEITITGSNFLQATNVFFNSVSASSFIVDSNTQIRAVVGAGTSTGKVGVSSLDGTALSVTDFEMVNPPTITVISPTSGPIGAVVTLVGNNFTGTTSVSVNGVPASTFVINNGSQLTLTVPVGASSGSISVTNPAGSASSTSPFTVVQAPAVSGFTPTTAPIGTQVTITGSNFSGISSVSFGGVPASNFTVDSASQIKADVPANATSGAIRVTNAGGTGQSSASFIVQAPPVVVSFSPPHGVAGTEVTISGGNFNDVSQVAFGGSPAAAFSVVSTTQIRATAPGGVITGPLTVVNGIGTGLSSANFAVVQSPFVTSFTPIEGPVGTELTITGANLQHIDQVAINGTPVSGLSIDSNSQIRTNIPSGASTGLITVTNQAGLASSSSAFSVIALPSSITLNPTDDVHVHSGKPDRNHAHDSNVWIRRTASNVRLIAYFKFSVTGLTGNPESAKLRLFVEDGSDDGGAIFQVSNNFQGTATAWDEDNLDFNNAPEVPNNSISSVGQATANQTVEFDLTSAITGNGIYSFAIENSSDDLLIYSANGTANPPQLVLETGVGVSNVPSITSFTPAAGGVGTEVTIVGLNLGGINSVQFNGLPAANFSVDADAQVRATAPAGASTGPIRVSSVAGTAVSLNDFEVPTGQTSFSFSPTDDAMVRSDVPDPDFGFGDILRARRSSAGVNHRGYMKFSVAGLNGPVTRATIRLFVVENSSVGGSIFAVSNNFLGTGIPWSEADLSFGNAPELSGDALSSVGSITAGETVEFDATAGISGNGVFSFVLSSSSNDAAIYHSKENATAPELIVETDGGASLPQPPSITSFTPTAGPVGTEVTVSGSDLDGATAVRFKTLSAVSFNLDSSTQLRAIVPAGATNGPISITTSDGTAVSSNSFSVLAPPTISSFAPTSGPVGQEVTIGGTNFSGLTDISFNGTSAASINLDSDSQVRAQVPLGATTGAITVSNALGSATTQSSFSVTNLPSVLSFTPATGTAGTVVTITGLNFTGASGVTFNASPAASFSVISDTQVQATVPGGASTGKIGVTNSDGTGASTTDFNVPAQPAISFFSPASGVRGSEVTIFGTSFSGVTDIVFNGAPAAEFSIDSDTQILATVPAGATSGLISLTNSIGTTVSATPFTVSSGIGTFSFFPSDDSYVRSSRETENFGTDADLKVRTSTAERNVYLKFNLSSLAGTVESAKIRLECTDGSTAGGSIFSVSNNFIGTGIPWTEEELAWINAPAISGTALSTLGNVGTGQIVEFDITAAIVGDGSYSFAIRNNNSDLANYSSKEGSTAPELVVTTGNGLSKQSPDTDESGEEAPVEVNSVALPDQPTLYANYPNPFNIETTIEYALPKDAKVQLRVFNLRGQEVRVLVDGFQKAGMKRVTWDGLNKDKKVVATGVYLVRFKVGELTQSRKITLQK